LIANGIRSYITKDVLMLLTTAIFSESTSVKTAVEKYIVSKKTTKN